MVLPWTMEKNTKKIGLFTLSMIVIGSMIGAGIFVVPNIMMPYGISGTLGWIIASFCSIVLACIFVDITLTSSNEGGLVSIISREYGGQAGFLAGFSQWFYLLIALSSILFTFVDYFLDFLHLSGEINKFLISLIVVSSLNIMHIFTGLGFKLLSSITILKVLLFSCCPILGIVAFNASNVFGIDISGRSLLSLAKLAFIENRSLVIPTIAKAVQASSIALFAFAGLENAAASSDVVKDPHKTVPRATMIGVLLCSVIYLFTHLCVVSALGYNTHSDTPVKTALSQLVNQTFGHYPSVAIGLFVSIVAVFGCLGTLLAIMFVTPNVLYDNLKIADSNFKSRRSRTGLPIKMSLICSLLVIVIAFLKYVAVIDLAPLQLTANFLLVYFYFKCVLAHFRISRNRLLTSLGLMACFILVVGCNTTSVFIGTIMQFFGEIMYARFATASSKTKPELSTKHETTIEPLASKSEATKDLSA